jgi:hypothetical protein
MCDIIKDRIRISKILTHTLGARLDNTPTNLEELTQLCVIALQIYYDGTCPVECVEDKARTFALWHLARNGHGDKSAIKTRPAAA